ncbi:MAG: DUF1028 domain-containing protein, partial [Rhodospirillales bacterium]|nr:DUF1028 domain-containing protein [Rhodospirillales bacterium]
RGHHVGDGFACQGNILVGRETVEAMATAFRASKGELSGRLVTALAAGEKAGGDKRGKQASALYVVRSKGGYGGMNDVRGRPARRRSSRAGDRAAPPARLARSLFRDQPGFREAQDRGGGARRTEGPHVIARLLSGRCLKSLGWGNREGARRFYRN